jgi:hypothetical protein
MAALRPIFKAPPWHVKRIHVKEEEKLEMKGRVNKEAKKKRNGDTSRAHATHTRGNREGDRRRHH